MVGVGLGVNVGAGVGLGLNVGVGVGLEVKVGVGVGDGVVLAVGGGAGVGVAVLTTKLLFDEPLQPASITRPSSNALSRAPADFTTIANAVAA